MKMARIGIRYFFHRLLTIPFLALPGRAKEAESGRFSHHHSLKSPMRSWVSMTLPSAS
jgi:hypothetical protein